MAITRDRILAQVQRDSQAYDALPDALKDILIKEIASMRRPYDQNERGAATPYMVMGVNVAA